MQIRDRELYKIKNGGEYETFEAYCRGIWDMGRNYMNKIIASSVVVDNLGTIVPTIPATESQARPLACLEPSQQIEAWQKALETAPEGRITAAHVNKVVKELRKKEEEQPTEEEKTPSKNGNKGKNDFVPTDAMNFATIAISQLERISLDDPKREEALLVVENLIAKNKRKYKSKTPDKLLRNNPPGFTGLYCESHL